MDIRSSFRKGNGGGGEKPKQPEVDMVDVSIPLKEHEAMYQVIIPIGITDGPEPEVREMEEDDDAIDAPFMVRERELMTFIRVLAYNKIPFHVEPM